MYSFRLQSLRIVSRHRLAIRSKEVLKNGQMVQVNTNVHCVIPLSIDGSSFKWLPPRQAPKAPLTGNAAAARDSEFDNDPRYSSDEEGIYWTLVFLMSQKGECG